MVVSKGPHDDKQSRSSMVRSSPHPGYGAGIVNADSNKANRHVIGFLFLLRSRDERGRMLILWSKLRLATSKG